MALITAADYGEVRAAIDAALTADELPDAIIGRDLYAGAAQRLVLARDPAAASRTGDAARRVRLAAICYCAALLVPAVVWLAAESHDGHSYSRVTPDPDALAAALRARADGEIAAVVTPDSDAALRPTMFRTAAGRRGL